MTSMGFWDWDVVRIIGLNCEEFVRIAKELVVGLRLTSPLTTSLFVLPKIVDVVFRVSPNQY